ncbi:MAG: hypothetical protein F4X56_01050 [Gammaproteobacteria bacterium]|nr:hypothetical protein [Gammaproteobacteria bacterium]MYC24488.1 hypothetical protein [Gammaproteobacteria bacterium]
MNSRTRKYLAQSAAATLDGLVLDLLVEHNDPIGLTEITRKLGLYDNTPEGYRGWIVTECLFCLEANGDVDHVGNKWVVINQ